MCFNTIAVRMQNCVSKKGYCSASLARDKTVCIMSEIAAYCKTEEQWTVFCIMHTGIGENCLPRRIGAGLLQRDALR